MIALVYPSTAKVTCHPIFLPTCDSFFCFVFIVLFFFYMTTQWLGNNIIILIFCLSLIINEVEHIFIPIGHSGSTSIPFVCLGEELSISCWFIGVLHIFQFIYCKYICIFQFMTFHSLYGYLLAQRDFLNLMQWIYPHFLCGLWFCFFEKILLIPKL